MGQHVHQQQGIPVGVLGLLGPLAVHRGAQFPLRHTRDTKSVGAPCNCSYATPARVREMVVAWGRWSRTNPRGSFSTGQCILARRAMWAMVV